MLGQLLLQDAKTESEAQAGRCARRCQTSSHKAVDVVFAEDGSSGNRRSDSGFRFACRGETCHSE